MMMSPSECWKRRNERAERVTTKTQEWDLCFFVGEKKEKSVSFPPFVCPSRRRVRFRRTPESRSVSFRKEEDRSFSSPRVTLKNPAWKYVNSRGLHFGLWICLHREARPRRHLNHTLFVISISQVILKLFFTTSNGLHHTVPVLFQLISLFFPPRLNNVTPQFVKLKFQFVPVEHYRLPKQESGPASIFNYSPHFISVLTLSPPLRQIVTTHDNTMW